MSTTAPVYRPDADYIDRQLDAELAAPVRTEPCPTPHLPGGSVDLDDAATEMAAIVQTARACVDDALSGVAYVTGPGRHDSALRELGPHLARAAQALADAGDVLRAAAT